MGGATTMPVPDRSLMQRRDALVNANDVRTYRKNLKRDIKAGKVSAVGLLMDPPDKIHTMKIFDLLLAIPAVGQVKVNRMLNRCRISPSKTVSGMSDRQRYEIVAALQGR